MCYGFDSFFFVFVVVLWYFRGWVYDEYNISFNYVICSEGKKK